MKRIFLLSIPVIALMALAPLPALATGGGDGGDSGTDSSVPEPYDAGFQAASKFFAAFFRTGSLAAAVHTVANVIDSDSTYIGYFSSRVDYKRLNRDERRRQTEEAQRSFVARVVEERARREAERQAQQDEWDNAAENQADDDLPGLYD